MRGDRLLQAPDLPELRREGKARQPAGLDPGAVQPLLGAHIVRVGRAMLLAQRGQRAQRRIAVGQDQGVRAQFQQVAQRLAPQFDVHFARGRFAQAHGHGIAPAGGVGQQAAAPPFALEGGDLAFEGLDLGA